MTPVLIIDDNEYVRRVFERIFERMSVPARVASDPREGLAALEQGPYRLIITDLRMPHVSGLEIVKEAAARWPATPVVVVTGFADAEDEFAIEAAGARLLRKPFKATAAIEIFEGLLQP